MLFFPQTAHADGITIDPAFQEIVLSEEQPIASASLSIKSEYEVPVELEVFAYDFMQVDHFGSLSLLNGFETAYPHTLASFLRLSEDRFVLDAYGTSTLTIRVQNRDTLDPGGHYAAVILRQVSDANNTRQVLPAVSSLVLLRKQGAERFHLSIDRVELTEQALRFSIPEDIAIIFRNEGNTHLTPRGSVRLYDVFNRSVYDGVLNTESVYVLPGTQRRIVVPIQKIRTILPIMILSLQIDGSGEPGQYPFRYENSFLYIQPLTLAICCIVSMLTTLFIIKKYRKKRVRKDKT